jgi:hypothetical protein
MEHCQLGRTWIRRGPAQDYRPRPRAMISFWISVVLPKIDWTRLRPPGLTSAADWRSRWSRRAPSGQREPRRSPGAIWAAITRQWIVSPRRDSPSRGVAPTTTPNQRPRISPAVDTNIESGELSAAQPPQVLGMHDASESSQVGPCSREPPRGNQYLSRGQDAHHHTMGTCGARWPPWRAAERFGGWQPRRPRYWRSLASERRECRISRLQCRA